MNKTFVALDSAYLGTFIADQLVLMARRKCSYDRSLGLPDELLEAVIQRK